MLALALAPGRQLFANSIVGLIAISKKVDVLVAYYLGGKNTVLVGRSRQLLVCFEFRHHSFFFPIKNFVWATVMWRKGWLNCVPRIKTWDDVDRDRGIYDRRCVSWCFTLLSASTA